MAYLHFFFSFLLIICAILIFNCQNPVYSLLFLILNFCFSAAILLLFRIEFLSLLCIMIYVGAVAVLFLFVIMMINTKNLKFDLSLEQSTIWASFFSFYILEFFYSYDNFYFNPSFYSFFLLSLNLDLINFSNIDVIGFSLYNFYSVSIILTGFILLIALIGSICLTLNFSNFFLLTQKDLKQLTRRNSISIKFYR